MARRWTKEETDILISLAPTCDLKEIAKILDRTEISVLSKINKMNIKHMTSKRIFSYEELDFIKNNWKKMKVIDIARELKVSRAMIQRQADLMGLPKLGNNPYRKWTDYNIIKLRNLSKTKTIAELAKYFKTTKAAISTVASHNNIKLIDEKIHWTLDDKKKLQEYAKTMDINEIAKVMNKNASAIRLQAKRQGIKVLKSKKKSDNIWTNENISDLKRLVSEGKTLVQISKIMNRKDIAIIKKANELNIKIKKGTSKTWTDEEIEKLKELSKTKSKKELVIIFGRTTASIKAMANKLNIKLITDRKNWTDEEVKLLRQFIEVDKKTPSEIAKILGRTENSIIIKISKLGLKITTNNKRYWDSSEEDLLSDLWGSMPIERIAKKLNRTESSVRNKVFQLGLGSQIDNNYEGLKLSDVANLLNINIQTISISWVSLGLKVKTRYISKVTSYKYVEIEDLYDFLEKNQNIWDSRYLEKNILGIEPDWLKEKRINDSKMENDSFRLDSFTKQQLINAKKYFLDLEDVDEKVLKKIK